MEVSELSDEAVRWAALLAREDLNFLSYGSVWLSYAPEAGTIVAWEFTRLEDPDPHSWASYDFKDEEVWKFDEETILAEADRRSL